MFHKKCTTCTNKTCLKTKLICSSLDNYLNSKTSLREKLPRKGSELEIYDYLTQGIDNNEVI